MSENVRNQIQAVLAIEVMQRLSKDGVCLLVQLGDNTFCFADKGLVKATIEDLAKFLVEKGCSEKDIEHILSKYEGGSHEQRQ